MCIYLGVISYIRLSGFTGFTIWMLVYFSKKIKFKDICKFFSIFSSIFLIAAIFFNKIGLLKSYLIVDNSSRLRNSLGFKYVSYPSEMIFFIICAYGIARGKKITLAEITALELVNAYIYFFTKTRDPFFLSTVFLIALIGVRYNLLSRIFYRGKLIFKYIFVINFGAISYFTFCLPTNLFAKLDKIVSYRLTFNRANFEIYGNSLFGKQLLFHTQDSTTSIENTSYNFIDSFYFQSMLGAGWLYLIIILGMFTVICKKAIQHNQFILLSSLIIISINAMFDPFLLVLWYSPFALLLSKAFSSKIE